MTLNETSRFSFKWFTAVALLVSVAPIILNSCSKSAGKVQISEPERNGRDAQVGNSPTPEPTKVPQPQNVEKIDEDDGSGPYLFSELKKNYKEADVVVYAEVSTFRPDNMNRGYRPYTLTAKVKEVFKGDFRLGDSIEFGYTSEVYDKEPDDSEFLGERILWLHRWKDKGKVRYGQIEFMAGGVEYNILEKLRKISKKTH